MSVNLLRCSDVCSQEENESEGETNLALFLLHVCLSGLYIWLYIE